MKRFFTASFIVLALLIGAAGVAPAAHAQFDSSTSIDDAVSRNEPTAAEQQAAVTPVDSARAVADAARTPAPGPGTKPDPDDGFNSIMMKIMQLFAWLVGAAMLTLNYAVYFTVVTMGSYVKNLEAVGATWMILRDIGNIFLIFGFIAVGVTTILNVDWYGGGKKMLPMMLVAAVFLNFSLFITEAFIDVGNLFATQFYTQINGPIVSPTSSGSGSITELARGGISGKIMSQLGLANLYGQAQQKNFLLSAAYPWLIGFMGIILFIILAFVLFSLAFVLIARFVILLFLIIVSPVAFAGLAVPGLKARMMAWWNKLFEQVITAPILLLMLYIALKIITANNFLRGFNGGVAGDWSGFASGNYAGFAGVLLSFFVAMGLLLAVVIQSKNLSAFGASQAMNLGGKLSFGATAWAGRRTVGRLSNYAARSIRSSKFGRSDMGKLFAGVADKGAKGSFDIRGTGVLKSLPGGGIDAGEAQKGGYHGREEELIKSRVEYAKTLRQTKEEAGRTDKAKEDKEKENTAHLANMKPLEEREQKQLDLSKGIVKASRAELDIKQNELKLARASADVDKIKAAETAYANDLGRHNEVKAAEEEKLDPIRKAIKLEKERHKTTIEGHEDTIKENSTAAVQKQYGRALKKHTIFGVIPRQPYDWTTAVGSARAEASKKIMGEADKDPILKQLDEMGAKLGKTTPSALAPSAPAAGPHT